MFCSVTASPASIRCTSCVLVNGRSLAAQAGLRPRGRHSSQFDQCLIRVGNQDAEPAGPRLDVATTDDDPEGSAQQRVLG